MTAQHEFQHSKLSALLGIVPLSVADDNGRYFAPWRTDRRPLAGLLQGIYAFVGVADAWRALREAEGAQTEAERQFATARLQVDTGLRAIEDRGALMPVGRTLADRLAPDHRRPAGVDRGARGGGCGGRMQTRTFAGSSRNVTAPGAMMTGRMT